MTSRIGFARSDERKPVTERPTYIVDASIAGRWFLRNPPYLDSALKVLDDFGAERIDLLAPDNFLYEVSSAIRHSAVIKLLTPTVARERIAEFLNLHIPTFDASDLILLASDLSFRFGCSFYDSLYLALSEHTRYRFIHADGKLHRTLDGRFPQELWVEDYSSVSPYK